MAQFNRCFFIGFSGKTISPLSTFNFFQSSIIAPVVLPETRVIFDFEPSVNQVWLQLDGIAHGPALGIDENE